MKDEYSEALTKLLRQISDTYYPNWNINNDWRVFEGLGNGTLPGYCEASEKIIWIYPPINGYSMESLLVHEIAHAITGGDHEQEFCAELVRVVAEARSRGDKNLADAVERDLNNMANAERVPPADENQLRAAYEDVFIDISVGQHMTFDDATYHAAQLIGLSVKELVTAFPNAKDLYKEALEVLGI